MNIYAFFRNSFINSSSHSLRKHISGCSSDAYSPYLDTKSCTCLSPSLFSPHTTTHCLFNFLHKFITPLTTLPWFVYISTQPSPVMTKSDSDIFYSNLFCSAIKSKPVITFAPKAATNPPTIPPDAPDPC